MISSKKILQKSCRDEEILMQTSSLSQKKRGDLCGRMVKHQKHEKAKRWVLRILQETREPGFVPSRNGQFISNIIAFRSDEVMTTVNIGSATAPETFKFAKNFWYCLDDPAGSEPSLPVPELDGIYGKDPMSQDAEKGDLR